MIWDTFAFALDDMRYLCFWRSGEWISTCICGAVSSWVICTPGIWYHLWGRRKNGVFRKALLGVHPQRWERVGHFLQFCFAKKWRSTYIGNSIASGGTVLLPLSTNVLIPQIRLFEIVTTLRSLNLPLRFLSSRPFDFWTMPFVFWTTRSSADAALSEIFWQVARVFCKAGSFRQICTRFLESRELSALSPTFVS